MTVWQWDPSLYSGSADYYANGRMPYPPGAVRVIRETLGLDGSGRLLDVGCGPGSLTLLLARFFAGTVAVDADADMVEAGRAAAESRGLRSISWRQLRAEELPADLGRFRVVTFAQSFHWMDQPAVARTVAGMLEKGGAVVHLGATTERGTGEMPRTALRYPQPPWAAIGELVERYLGTERRAGRTLRGPMVHGAEDDAFAAAGFEAPWKIQVPNGVTRVRIVDEIVAAVFSLSYSAPHLFGDRLPEFEAQLRELLNSEAAFGGLFAEEVGGVGLSFYRAPAAARKAPAVRKPAAGKTTAARKSAAAKTPAAEPVVPTPRPKARRATKKA